MTFPLVGSIKRLQSGPSMPFFTFKTTFQGEVTFSITQSGGNVADWYMGDGTVIFGTNEVTHTYSDPGEKTVSVAVPGFEFVTGLGNFDSKNITFFDASSLINPESFSFNNNEGISFLPPNNSQAQIRFLRFENCGLTSFDLSFVNALGVGNNRAFFDFAGNPNLSGFSGYPASPSGAFERLNISNCNFSILDFSWIQVGSNCAIIANNNPLLSQIIPANGVQYRNVQFVNCGFSGTFDLSFWSNYSSFTCFLRLDSNSITDFIMPPTMGNGSGFDTINIANNNLNSVDFSWATRWAGNRILNLQNSGTNELILPVSTAINNGPRQVLINGSNMLTLDLSAYDNKTTSVILQSSPNPIETITPPTASSVFTSVSMDVSAIVSGELDFSFVSMSEKFNLSMGGKIFDLIKIPNFTGGAAPFVRNSGFQFSAKAIDVGAQPGGWPNVNYQRSEINNPLTSAEVNKILADIDAIASTFNSLGISRLIFPGLPDSSSGGFDGLAAKNSLISKGYEVTTN